MWGYIQALRYNVLSDFSNLPTVLALMGDVPPAASERTAYLTTLNTVANNLQNVYGFSDAQMMGW